MTNPTSPVRVRYAPSPTGIPHIGNIRTALFCWVLAQQTKGQFIVRIEDTDRSRYDADAEKALKEAVGTASTYAGPMSLDRVLACVAGAVGAGVVS